MRDVQHFQNPCVSFLCGSGALSSVLSVPSACDSTALLHAVHLCTTTSHRTQASVYPETDSHILSIFQVSIKQESMFNPKGAQGKIYLLQTIHLYTLYDICIDKAAVL